MKPCDEVLGKDLETCCVLSHGQVRGGLDQAGSAFEAQLNLTAPRIPTQSRGLGGSDWSRRGRRGGTRGVQAWQAPLRGHPRRGTGSYLRIWVSCCPPPPRGPRSSRSPVDPSDGAPCSPARRDPAARTGRSNAAAAAPWLRTGEEGRWAGGESCPRSGPGLAAPAELGACD